MPDAMWLQCHVCSEIFEAGRRPLGSRVPCPECGADARVEQSQLRHPPPRIISQHPQRQARHVTNQNPQALFAFITGLGCLMAVILYAIVSRQPVVLTPVRSRMIETYVPIRFRDYEELQSGMTLAEANKVLGSDGIEQSRSGGFVSYLWSNGDGTGVSATFDNGRLSSKGQHRLR